MAVREVDVQLRVVEFQAKYKSHSFNEMFVCSSLLYLAPLCLEAAECNTEVKFNLCVSL